MYKEAATTQHSVLMEMTTSVLHHWFHQAGMWNPLYTDIKIYSSHLLSETLQYPQKSQGNFLTKHEGGLGRDCSATVKSEDNFQYILQIRGSKNAGNRQPVPVGSHWWTQGLQEINGLRKSPRSLLQAEMAQLMHDCQAEHCSTNY